MEENVRSVVGKEHPTLKVWEIARNRAKRLNSVRDEFYIMGWDLCQESVPDWSLDP